MSPDVLHELDWLLSQHLSRALAVEKQAVACGLPLEHLTNLRCVRLLLQLRSAGLS